MEFLVVALCAEVGGERCCGPHHRAAEARCSEGAKMLPNKGLHLPCIAGFLLWAMMFCGGPGLVQMQSCIVTQGWR